jgi:LuxR family transcriptional regulator, maltose regulon positive regulatory protein
LLAPLLAPKLRAPSSGTARLARARLHRQLEEALEGGCGLLLVVAPAGYGKSTLLGGWLRDSGRKAAWLSLDEAENDPTRFWRYVVAALQQAEPAWGRGLLPLLDLSPPAAPETIAGVLVQEIEESPREQHLLLVLDDYHLIQAPAVHNSLLFLLTHLPADLRLVLLSRADPPLPLARLRVQAKLLELRAADLRFTLEEVSQLLNHLLGLGLPPAAIATLAERTEGWAAGLQLAALSLKGRPAGEIAAFLNEFGGTHQHVLAYLMEEVLARQPEQVQRFLLRTSILQRLYAPLCDHLAAIAGSHQVLASLEYQGLFTVRLDNGGQWYRYHHLFAEMLRARLGETHPEQPALLHRQASEWLAAQGHLEEAIHHALAAEAWDLAANLIEEAGERLWGQGGLATLLRWLEALPGDLVQARPRLSLLFGWILFLADQYEEAAMRWQVVEQIHEQSGTVDPLLRGVLAAMRGALAAMQQDAPRATVLSREALQHLPAEAATWRGVTTINLGLAHAARGEVVAAARAFGDAARLCQRNGNTYLTFAALWHLAEVQLLAGKLREAERAYEWIEQVDEHDSAHPLALPGYAAIGQGGLAYERDDLDAAERHLTAGMGHLPPGAQPRVLLYALVTRAWLRQARGQAEAARGFMEQAVALVERVGLREERAPLAARLAWLALRQGRVWEAEAWASASGLSARDEPAFGHEVEHLVLARLLLARGQPGQARELLERLLAAASRDHRLARVIEILTLRALALSAEGRDVQAQSSLHRALDLAEPEGYMRSFLDAGAPLLALVHGLAESEVGSYARRLLASAAEPISSVPLLDPLTPRELAVLNLMARGLSNKQIADELIISLGTVKGHINHIRSKLPAHNRTEAVVRAQALHLLEHIQS